MTADPPAPADGPGARRAAEFAAVDADGDGSISRAEAKAAFPESYTDELYNLFDADGKNGVSFKEV